MNPYAGSSFARSYYYARPLPVAQFRKGEWGSWADVKEGAAGLLEKELSRAKSKGKFEFTM